MLLNIFKFEIKYWLKNPLPYVFAIILFAISFLTMWGMSAEAKVGDNIAMMNSYYKLNNMANLFSLLLIFLLPAIIGNSIFRDYTSRIFTVLYSYPFTKRDYLLAKFSSAFCVVFGIVVIMVLGFLFGTLMPGVKKEALLDFNALNYLQLLFVYLIPNMFLIACVVFGVVLYTRNIYISFISVILIIMVQAFGKGVLAVNGLQYLAAILDPLGESAVKYTVRYWTLEERNNLVLPLNGVILLNRVLWISMSLLILIWTYIRFDFGQFAKSGSYKKNALVKIENQVKTSKPIVFPKVNTDFSFTNQLKTSWHLSTIEFRTIIFSWPFLSILLAGLMLVLFQQHQMAPESGIVFRPITANMLRVPMFFFSGVVNLMTFLYVGILVYKAKMNRFDGIIDSVPQTNWVLLFSKFLAILKMQLLLLTLVMIGGITAQVLSGYFRFEIAHYAFELFVLNSIHFIIWTCLAICVHSISKNMYLGYFLLILIPTSLIFLPSVADYLGLDLLKETIFYYNNVKGQFLGFDYSDFNGYGSQLIGYFVYKIYWLISGIGFLIISLLWWKRGLTFSFLERWNLAKSRFKGALKYSLLLGFTGFVLTGFTIYYQEHYVSQISFSDKDEERIMVQNEKRYFQFKNYIQPQLTAIDMTMDLYPSTQDFVAKGVMTFVNKTSQPIDTIIIAKSFKEKTTCEVLSPHQIFNKDEDLFYDFIALERGLEFGDSLNIAIEISNYPNTFLHHNSRVVSNGTYIQPHILPKLGIRNVFIKNKKKRKENNLPERNFEIANNVDSTYLGYSYTNNNMGRIDFECVLSTSEEQTALSIGDLERQWTKDGRNFYHYKSKGLIKNTMAWLSGVFDKVTRKSKHQFIEMYRHTLHDHNDKHMFDGVVASLDYCSDLFGPLVHDTLKIIEFPVTKGTFATLNGNLIPYSESYFHCDVHDHENDYFNMPFFVSAHEVAHYWWGHRVDPANVPGGRFITEGMADYLALKIVEKQFGEAEALSFRKKYHKVYLSDRAQQSNETALVQSSLDNEFLNYRKACLSLYAMSAHLGEETLHKGLVDFEQKNKFTEPPFPTSLDFVECIRGVTPDSLKYLVSDMFEKITLYNNSIEQVSISENNGVYDVIMDMNISKYYADQKGKRMYGDHSLSDGVLESVQLNDYITIGFLNDEDKIVETKKLLIKEIKNTVSFTLNEKPSQIVIDPNYLSIDVNRDDDVWRLN